MSKPFFRADQVGSLLRPARLIAARADFENGVIDHETLHQTENEAISEVVKQQEACGFQVVVDGEYRRENWWIDFIKGIAGIEIREGSAAQAFVAPQKPDCNCGHGHAKSDEDEGWKYVPKNVLTTGKLDLPHSVNAEDFQYLRSTTQRTAKITLPSPTRLHFHGGRDAVSREAYPDIEKFFEDVVQIYRQEISSLEEAGCRYIQIDDPLMTYFISDRLRAEIVTSGEDPDERLRRYVELTNACIAQRKPETAIGIHVCRGNSRSGWIAEGGYQRIAEDVLGGLKVDHFLLEYDDERSGDFEPLRAVPKGIKVVLGLVTTKFPHLESADDLIRRIDAASKFVPLEDLAISPQCGFASTVEGNIITPEDQWRKLDRIVEVAQRVWGSV
jgi:5-methyltetrahydropteroyltriglutamate--homocysteine methyltransferase